MAEEKNMSVNLFLTKISLYLYNYFS